MSSTMKLGDNREQANLREARRFLASAVERGLQIVVGSRDEANLFVNGKEVHRGPVRHGIVAVQNIVPGIAPNGFQTRSLWPSGSGGKDF